MKFIWIVEPPRSRTKSDAATPTADDERTTKDKTTEQVTNAAIATGPTGARRRVVFR